VTEIGALRTQIDEIDERLVSLLNERAACALAIGEIKAAHGLPVYQPTREGEVLAHVRRVNAGPLDGDAMARLFERIIDEARRLESGRTAAQQAGGSADMQERGAGGRAGD
jgi:chorismate mutase